MKNTKGFTLVELMIVIAIIAILAVGSSVAYASHIKRARDSQRITAYRNIAQALSSYSAEFGTYPLPDSQDYVFYCIGKDTCHSGSYPVNLLNPVADMTSAQQQFNERIASYVDLDAFSVPSAGNSPSGLELDSALFAYNPFMQTLDYVFYFETDTKSVRDFCEGINAQFQADASSLNVAGAQLNTSTMNFISTEGAYEGFKSCMFTISQV